MALDEVDHGAHVRGIPVGLELDERAGGVAAGERREELVERRHPLPRVVAAVPGADVEPAQLGEVEVADRPRVARDALERGVVEEHRHAVAAQLHVGLDEVEVVHRQLERRHRVLGRLGAVAAVPDDERGVAGQAQRTEDVDRRRRRGGRRDEQGRGGHDRAGERARDADGTARRMREAAQPGQRAGLRVRACGSGGRCDRGAGRIERSGHGRSGLSTRRAPLRGGCRSL